MNVATFDKLAYLDALKAGGVTEEQARAHANALDSALREGVATNATLKAEIAGLRTELQAEIAGLRAEFQTEIADVRREIADLRAELKGDIADLRAELKADIADAKTQMVKWMFAAMAAQTALIVALLRLF